MSSVDTQRQTPGGTISKMPSTVTVSTPISHHYSPKSRTTSSTAHHDTTPNYFNLTVDSSKSCQSSGGGSHARANFSPPTSRVRSTAAISPKVIPMDQNPAFEAFRKQSDLRGMSNNLKFSLPSGNGQLSPPFSGRSQPSDSFFPQQSPRSPKRSLPTPFGEITDRPRRLSPAPFNDLDKLSAPMSFSSLNDSGNANSLPHSLTTSPLSPISPRSGTLPLELNAGEPFASASHVATLLEANEEEVLLLDLRVSTQYSRSCIQGALNLCCPTTLLKRPMYDTRKLADTFKSPDQRRKFEKWRTCRYIVVYDVNSSRPKDSQTCVSMLKKFTAEGWSGVSYIIRGGFHDFSKQFPNLIHYGAGSSSNTDNESPNPVAPVIGGCPMPMTKTAANPFFGNIRQNMDLIGGVGQIPLKRPRSMSSGDLQSIPKWLKIAADEDDQGKVVADKFLAIEKEEQKRLTEALSDKVAYESTSESKADCIKLAGIEKGNKNRYNNIWPYEHSRVKIQGLRDGACDYINASHIKSSVSEKRYIATQGPIPATFNDFWNVVWQQDVRVIVMLTALSEGGQMKAHNYWEDKRYGPIHLNFLSEHRASIDPVTLKRHRERRSTHGSISSQHADKDQPAGDAYITVRRFAVSHDGEPFERMREITHLQYSNWPDFGAPAEPAHLLGLVEQTDAVARAAQASTRDRARPIMVHCSAGCGRTGTFCTVDMILDAFRSKNLPDSDLVEKVVRELRLQRLSMVQSLRQYVLCYETILEWVVQQIQSRDLIE